MAKIRKQTIRRVRRRNKTRSKRIRNRKTTRNRERVYRKSSRKKRTKPRKSRRKFIHVGGSDEPEPEPMQSPDLVASQAIGDRDFAEEAQIQEAIRASLQGAQEDPKIYHEVAPQAIGDGDFAEDAQIQEAIQASMQGTQAGPEIDHEIDLEIQKMSSNPDATQVMQGETSAGDRTGMWRAQGWTDGPPWIMLDRSQNNVTADVANKLFKKMYTENKKDVRKTIRETATRRVQERQRAHEKHSSLAGSLPNPFEIIKYLFNNMPDDSMNYYFAFEDLYKKEKEQGIWGPFSRQMQNIKEAIDGQTPFERTLGVGEMEKLRLASAREKHSSLAGKRPSSAIIKGSLFKETPADAEKNCEAFEYLYEEEKKQNIWGPFSRQMENIKVKTLRDEEWVKIADYIAFTEAYRSLYEKFEEWMHSVRESIIFRRLEPRARQLLRDLAEKSRVVEYKSEETPGGLDKRFKNVILTKKPTSTLDFSTGWGARDEALAAAATAAPAPAAAPAPHPQ